MSDSKSSSAVTESVCVQDKESIACIYLRYNDVINVPNYAGSCQVGKNVITSFIILLPQRLHSYLA